MIDKSNMETVLIRRVYEKIKRHLADPQELFVVVSIEKQRLFVCSRAAIIERFDASSSRFGNGIRENSYKTPPGLHRIKQIIGSGAPAGRIFKDRIDTGTNWDSGPAQDNLILTRILRLEGVEQGINMGPGVDSYERFIYIHGTNKEYLIGTPMTHGCVCLRNHDIIRLCETVREGTFVFIDPPPIIIGEIECRSAHFTGIFGSGMSALAQYLRFQGITVSGTDRLVSREDTACLQRSLEALGCAIGRQDGTLIRDDTDAVFISTAIEESNPDITAARDNGIPVLHRSDLLAAIIASKQTIAVAGTSGKSTVTAMIFEFLTACGKSPSLLCGANLLRLEKEGAIGNAFSGGSDILVVEADESDGSIVKYYPDAAVVLNISKDHKTTDEIKELFAKLIAQSSWVASNADDPLLASLPADARFGKSNVASWRVDHEQLLPISSRLSRHGYEFHLPLPGKHNLENLSAALCVCEYFGCEMQLLTEAVKSYEGVARRFSVTETAHKVHVVDDFAHNPAKIEAVIDASRGLSKRIIAVYQPHGYGPTRFLKEEYINVFRKSLHQHDSLYLLPIYYAGGTAQKNISSLDIIRGLDPVSFTAQAVNNRDDLLNKIKIDAKPGDCILIMGARDPSLPLFVRDIIEIFGGSNRNV